MPSLIGLISRANRNGVTLTMHQTLTGWEVTARRPLTTRAPSAKTQYAIGFAADQSLHSAISTAYLLCLHDYDTWTWTPRALLPVTIEAQPNLLSKLNLAPPPRQAQSQIIGNVRRT